VLGLDVHLAARRGDLPRARAALADLQRAIAAEGYASASQAHDILAAALPAGMAVDEVRGLVELVGTFPGNRLTPEHPWSQLLRAQLAEAEGRHGEAAVLYAAAARSTDDGSGVLARHRGTAHVAAARCHIAVGALEEARPHAVAAAAHLARWRGWRVAELEAVQRRLGMGAEVSGPEALTPREREVAALLGEGLTNAGLAEQLYISPRTAAVHVSNILAKLGMSSRTEVATWAVREGLTRDGI
jgi:DNA-binding CsgD family transcriptional regulator